jgi:hypothetical protein
VVDPHAVLMKAMNQVGGIHDIHSSVRNGASVDWLSMNHFGGLRVVLLRHNVR